MTVAESFQAAPRRSLKWRSYFHVYQELLERFRGKAITLVEIGILDGGALFVWRQFLGPQARIIGVDLNPQCRELEKDGFEIFIGDQSMPHFWSDFYAKVGRIDVLIDDGGHTNHNQLATLLASLDRIRDGGLILVEDVHASYMQHYGNPSRYSFINRCKQAIDEINARHPFVGNGHTAFANAVHSISFYESIVAFQVNRPFCVVNELVANKGQSMKAMDQQHVINRPAAFKLGQVLKRIPLLKRIARWAYYRWEDRRVRGFF